jgi:hypothetical protein
MLSEAKHLILHPVLPSKSEASLRRGPLASARGDKKRLGATKKARGDKKGVARGDKKGARGDMDGVRDVIPNWELQVALPLVITPLLVIS